MSEYQIHWKRDSSKPRPEDTLDVDTRRDAIRESLEDIGVTKDKYRIEPTKRILGGDLPYFEVANLVLLGIDTAILVKEHIEQQGDEAVLGEKMKQRIEEDWREEDEIELKKELLKQESKDEENNK